MKAAILTDEQREFLHSVEWSVFNAPEELERVFFKKFRIQHGRANMLIRFFRDEVLKGKLSSFNIPEDEIVPRYKLPELNDFDFDTVEVDPKKVEELGIINGRAMVRVTYESKV